MPFGLINAPAVFMDLMNRVFREFLDQFVIVFIDDVLIYSHTEEEYAEHLRQVLQIVREHCMLSMRNADSGYRRCSFGGHVASELGIAVDLSKVSAVREWVHPTTSMKVRSFMGLAVYYRRFIREFSKIAGPLTNLTRKGVPYV